MSNELEVTRKVNETYRLKNLDLEKQLEAANSKKENSYELAQTEIADGIITELQKRIKTLMDENRKKDEELMIK